MKKSIIMLSFLALTFQVLGQGFTGDSWANSKQKKSGNVIVTYTYAPKFAEVNGEKKSGLCFDILNDFTAYVKSKYGVTLNITYKTLSDPKDFDLFLNTVKASNGGVFGLGDVTITDARKKEYNFSSPYFSNVAILATNNNVPTLSSLDKIGQTFAGKIALVQNGTTHEDRVKKIKSAYFPNLKIETTKGFAEPNYFTYIDLSTYLDVISNRIPLKRHPAGDQKEEDFGFLMPKSSDWAPVFNEFLAADGGYLNSVEYRKLLVENLGSNVLNLMDAITK
jgi:ABC-type amino acid transport substrate-binding protein